MSWHVDDDDRELWGPSVDACAICGDSECCGNCYSSLFDDDCQPIDDEAHARIEQIQAWVRRGRYFEQIERVLAEAENRQVPPKWGDR